MSKENGISSIIGGILVFFGRHLFPMDSNRTSFAEVARRCDSSFGKMVSDCGIVSDINLFLIIASIFLVLFGIYKIYESEKNPKKREQGKKENTQLRLSLFEFLGYILILIAIFTYPGLSLSYFLGFWHYFFPVLSGLIGIIIVIFARKRKKKIFNKKTFK
jgi:cell division protein FtsW (lipid II flippase)